MADWLRVKWVRISKKNRPVISIPGRIVRLSTRRSRLKRLVREAVRLEKGRIGGKGGLFFFVKGPVPEQPGLKDVRSILRDFLRKE